MKVLQQRLRHYLSNQPEWVFAIFASLSAFFTYSCMYAFRKPFTLATYEGLYFAGVDYKIWLITAQVCGYTLSKFAGINYISGLVKSQRIGSILILIGIAELSLFFFSFIPSPYNIIFLFFNGLPLGMIWGVVFSYLEGRRLTEILGAVLSASFIIASGFVKSVGKMTMSAFHINEFSMPFVTGLFFIIPLIISVVILDSLPEPTLKDELLRNKRVPMNNEDRKKFLIDFFPAIILLVITYIFLTVFRELRDNFAAEIWTSLGFGNNALIFTNAEIPVTIITLGALALIAFIRDNYFALQSILSFIILGFFIVLIFSVLFVLHRVNGQVWMILVGVGLYLGYIPFNAFLFERLISTFRCVGNIGFVMYISDAFGYLGSLGVVLFKNFENKDISWVKFFTNIGIGLSVIGILLLTGVMFYLNHKYRTIKNKNYEFKFNSGESVFAVNSGSSLYK